MRGAWIETDAAAEYMDVKRKSPLMRGAWIET